MAIIGIDLGTTNSLVGVWKNGKCKLIPNRYGEYLTPSVVSVSTDGEMLVGKAAKERLINHPEKTASVFKRYMGYKHSYTLGKKKYSATDLSAIVLKSLKEDAERYLGEKVTEAVISVPAYFDDKQRSATKQAGELAGLTVERIVNEPSAAALACRMENQDGDTTYMVFDFGGGTLDVSIVECFEEVVSVIAVNGDNRLGGVDFDRAIAIHFVNEMGKQYKALPETTQAAILAISEACKKELTEKEEVTMSVDCDGIQGELKLDRRLLIKIAKSVFERMRQPIFQALSDSDLNITDIDHIIMVGGSSKMPVVKYFIEHTFRKCVSSVASPDEIVAMGVATYAGIKERQDDVSDIVLTDICPFSLGTQIINQSGMKDLMSVIIERNSPLPISRTHNYVTVQDSQERLRFKIYQGEQRYADDNVMLGEMEVPVPKNIAGKESADVRFTYDINGILDVDVTVKSTGYHKRMVITGEGSRLSETELKAKLEEMKQLKISPLELEENIHALEWGKSLYVRSNSKQKDYVSRLLTQFEKALNTQNDVRIQVARKKMLRMFTMLEQGMLGNLMDLNVLDEMIEHLDNDVFDEDFYDDEFRELDEDEFRELDEADFDDDWKE